ncbi:MAG: phosphocholine cytidylyltransferase family protein [Planctomycetota bacterium]
MKACFLAAGRGSRLKADDLPKPLWEIGGGVSILERQIQLLQSFGVSDIAVVIGWRKEFVRERLGHTGVTFVENTHPDISESGTSHSFQFAACSEFDPLDGSAPCLLFDADLVYERAVLATVLNDETPGSRLLVSPNINEDAEEVRVYDAAGTPKLIGKGLRSPMTDGLNLTGEATGIVRFEPEDHALVRGALDWLVGRGDRRAYGYSGIASEHEELAQYLMNLGRLGAIKFAPELLFMEADFAEDFERVRNDLYPRILQKDGS